MGDCCKHECESSGFIQGGEFLDRRPLASQGELCNVIVVT
jgi:hypothetical protein